MTGPIIELCPFCDHIPTEGLTFGTLIRAQVLGDYEALIEAKRKVIQIHLPNVQVVEQVIEVLS